VVNGTFRSALKRKSESLEEFKVPPKKHLKKRTIVGGVEKEGTRSNTTSRGTQADGHSRLTIAIGNPGHKGGVRNLRVKPPTTAAKRGESFLSFLRWLRLMQGRTGRMKEGKTRRLTAASGNPDEFGKNQEQEIRGTCRRKKPPPFRKALIKKNTTGRPKGKIVQRHTGGPFMTWGSPEGKNVIPKPQKGSSLPQKPTRLREASGDHKIVYRHGGNPKKGGRIKTKPRHKSRLGLIGRR